MSTWLLAAIRQLLIVVNLLSAECLHVVSPSIYFIPLGLLQFVAARHYNDGLLQKLQSQHNAAARLVTDARIAITSSRQYYMSYAGCLLYREFNSKCLPGFLIAVRSGTELLYQWLSSHFGERSLFIPVLIEILYLMISYKQK